MSTAQDGGDGHTSAEVRCVVIALLRTLVAVAALLLVYFQMPFESRDNMLLALTAVVLGLAAFGVIFVRQMRRIRDAEHPMLRAVEAVALVASLFVVVVAAIHHNLWLTDPNSYSEPLSRLDALYFTVTTLATVGFGDITPTSELTRAVTTVQMVLGVALLGAGVRVLIGVAQQAREDRLRDSSAA